MTNISSETKWVDTHGIHHVRRVDASNHVVHEVVIDGVTFTRTGCQDCINDGFAPRKTS